MSDTLSEEHWRTLVANEINGVPCSQKHEADYLHTKSLLLSSEGSSEMVWTEVGSRYWQAIADACGGRKYFSTKGGRMGLGPTDLKPDDNICVLYGGGPLFFLRSDEGKDTAQLVGEA